MNKDSTCNQCLFGFILNSDKTTCVRVDSITPDYNPFNCKRGSYLKNFVCTACKSNISNCESCNA
jgi:hypothetical protein